MHGAGSANLGAAQLLHDAAGMPLERLFLTNSKASQRASQRASEPASPRAREPASEPRRGAARAPTADSARRATPPSRLRSGATAALYTRARAHRRALAPSPLPEPLSARWPSLATGRRSAPPHPPRPDSNSPHLTWRPPSSPRPPNAHADRALFSRRTGAHLEGGGRRVGQLPQRRAEGLRRLAAARRADQGASRHHRARTADRADRRGRPRARLLHEGGACRCGVDLFCFPSFFFVWPARDVFWTQPVLRRASGEPRVAAAPPRDSVAAAPPRDSSLCRGCREARRDRRGRRRGRERRGDPAGRFRAEQSKLAGRG